MREPDTKEVVIVLKSLFPGSEGNIPKLNSLIRKINPPKNGNVISKSEIVCDKESPTRKTEIIGNREKGFSFRTTGISSKFRLTPSATLVSQEFIDSSKSIVSYKESRIRVSNQKDVEADRLSILDNGKQSKTF